MAGVVMSPESGGLGFDETELRLGLPGGDGGGDVHRNTGKRGFSETIDLKLKLHTREEEAKDDSKDGKEKMATMTKKKTPPVDPAKPPAPKAQVVGWPPVRSFRKNALSTHSSKVDKDDVERPTNGATTVAAFVKVSMDGAPYLRKVDLKMYKSYQDLSFALEKMFNSFTSGSQGMHGRDFMNESKLMDLLHGSDYVPTYEDKDGDWMLVGDVPWEMFVASCRRLRIMKGSEAIGIAPRAVEKCKNRS